MPQEASYMVPFGPKRVLLEPLDPEGNMERKDVDCFVLDA